MCISKYVFSSSSSVFENNLTVRDQFRASYKDVI